MPEKKFYKTVLMPIEVAAGDFCWEHTGDRRICGYFNNEGGRPRCELRLDSMHSLRYGPDGVPKPPECLRLKEARSPR